MRLKQLDPSLQNKVRGIIEQLFIAKKEMEKMDQVNLILEKLP